MIERKLLYFGGWNWGQGQTDIPRLNSLPAIDKSVGKDVDRRRKPVTSENTGSQTIMLKLVMQHNLDCFKYS